MRLLLTAVWDIPATGDAWQIWWIKNNQARLILMGFLHTKIGGIYVPDLLKFSMQLAMIKQLLSKKLITEKEYALLKTRLMSDYNIPAITVV